MPILETDVIPRRICENCRNVTIKMFEFRERSLKTDAFLKKQYDECNELPEKKSTDPLHNNTQTKTKRELCEKKKTIHPTISNIFLTCPNIKLPSNVLSCNVNPSVCMELDVVEKFYAANKLNMNIATQVALRSLKEFNRELESQKLKIKEANEKENSLGINLSNSDKNSILNSMLTIKLITKETNEKENSLNISVSNSDKNSKSMEKVKRSIADEEKTKSKHSVKIKRRRLSSSDFTSNSEEEPTPLMDTVKLKENETSKIICRVCTTNYRSLHRHSKEYVHCKLCNTQFKLVADMNAHINACIVKDMSKNDIRVTLYRINLDKEGAKYPILKTILMTSADDKDVQQVQPNDEDSKKLNPSLEETIPQLSSSIEEPAQVHPVSSSSSLIVKETFPIPQKTISQFSKSGDQFVKKARKSPKVTNDEKTKKHTAKSGEESMQMQTLNTSPTDPNNKEPEKCNSIFKKTTPHFGTFSEIRKEIEAVPICPTLKENIPQPSESPHNHNKVQMNAETDPIISSTSSLLCTENIKWEDEIQVKKNNENQTDPANIKEKVSDDKQIGMQLSLLGALPVQAPVSSDPTEYVSTAIVRPQISIKDNDIINKVDGAMNDLEFLKDVLKMTCIKVEKSVCTETDETFTDSLENGYDIAKFKDLESKLNTCKVPVLFEQGALAVGYSTIKSTNDTKKMHLWSSKKPIRLKAVNGTMPIAASKLKADFLRLICSDSTTDQFAHKIYPTVTKPLEKRVAPVQIIPSLAKSNTLDRTTEFNTESVRVSVSSSNNEASKQITSIPKLVLINNKSNTSQTSMKPVIKIDGQKQVILTSNLSLNNNNTSNSKTLLGGSSSVRGSVSSSANIVQQQPFLSSSILLSSNENRNCSLIYPKAQSVSNDTSSGQSRFSPNTTQLNTSISNNTNNQHQKLNTNKGSYNTIQTSAINGTNMSLQSNPNNSIVQQVNLPSTAQLNNSAAPPSNIGGTNNQKKYPQNTISTNNGIALNANGSNVSSTGGTLTYFTNPSNELVGINMPWQLNSASTIPQQSLRSHRILRNNGDVTNISRIGGSQTYPISTGQDLVYMPNTMQLINSTVSTSNSSDNINRKIYMPNNDGTGNVTHVSSISNTQPYSINSMSKVVNINIPCQANSSVSSSSTSTWNDTNVFSMGANATLPKNISLGGNNQIKESRLVKTNNDKNNLTLNAYKTYMPNTISNNDGIYISGIGNTPTYYTSPMNKAGDINIVCVGNSSVSSPSTSTWSDTNVFGMGANVALPKNISPGGKNQTKESRQVKTNNDKNSLTSNANRTPSNIKNNRVHKVIKPKIRVKSLFELR